MKLRSIIATIIITISTFGAILYTSCTKDKCKNTTCQNGGSCSNGFCICPRGYTGDYCEIPATSYINYMNNSYTDITLTLNNHAYTVPAGEAKGFTGQFGDTMQGNAFTKGPYGEQINWDTVMNIFPINGTLTVNFNVDTTYFYLVVVNDSASAQIKEINVNKGLLTEKDIIFNTPSQYLGYQSSIGLGYFYASTANSNVYLKTAFGSAFNFPAPLWTTLSQNQYVQVTAH